MKLQSAWHAWKLSHREENTNRVTFSLWLIQTVGCTIARKQSPIAHNSVLCIIWYAVLFSPCELVYANNSRSHQGAN